MAGVLQSFLLILLLAQVYGYKTCNYRGSQHHSSTLLIRCSDSEYCCEKGCCRKVYSIWYFWTLLLFGLFVALIFCWWYKAHSHRQQTRAVIQQRSAIIPMQVVQPYPHQPMHYPNQQNYSNQQNYPNQQMPQYPVYTFAPPPYAMAVNQPPPNSAPPTYTAQTPPQAGQPKP